MSTAIYRYAKAMWCTYKPQKTICICILCSWTFMRFFQQQCSFIDLIFIMGRWDIPYWSRPVTKTWRLFCFNVSQRQDSWRFNVFQEDKHFDTIGRNDPKIMLESFGSAIWNLYLAENYRSSLLFISVSRMLTDLLINLWVHFLVLFFEPFILHVTVYHLFDCT